MWQAAELARTQEATAEVLRQGEAGVQRREKALRQREGVVAAAERKVAAASARGSAPLGHADADRGDIKWMRSIEL